VPFTWINADNESAHESRNVKSSEPAEPATEALPSYLLDRSNPKSAKALSSAIKNKRKEAAARFSVPLPKVKGISEEEMFSVVKTGKKTKKKSWKRMITKPTFVGPGESTLQSGCCALKVPMRAWSAQKRRFRYHRLPRDATRTKYSLLEFC
jgi:hypothetical protein